jgi:hypothetical protein
MNFKNKLKILVNCKNMKGIIIFLK